MADTDSEKRLGRWLAILLFGLVCGALGQSCEQEKGETKKALAILMQKLDAMEAARAQDRKALDALLKRPSPPPLDPRALYILSDVVRESKMVAQILSTHSFAKGDRIFVGDDMWDVVYVKVFLDEYENLRKVELLVSFAGKARDRKE